MDKSLAGLLLEKSLAGLLQPTRTADVAKAVGVNVETVRYWRVSATYPLPQHLKPLAKVLRVSLAQLSEVIAREKATRLRKRRETRAEKKRVEAGG